MQVMQAQSGGVSSSSSSLSVVIHQVEVDALDALEALGRGGGEGD